MSIVTLECPGCGNWVAYNSDFSEHICPDCGEEFIDDSIPQDEEAEEMGEGGWADKVYPPNREDED